MAVVWLDQFAIGGSLPGPAGQLAQDPGRRFNILADPPSFRVL
jgi:hypothetical protein